MGNTYTREDSVDSNGRSSRSSSILRKYSKSLKCRETESFSKCSSAEEHCEESDKKPKDGLERQVREDRSDVGKDVHLEPPPQLTEEQKETVKRTWKIIEASVAKVGVVLFMGLFETHPDVQEVFTPFRGLPMEEVQQSKELRAHALRLWLQQQWLL
ncbi:hypothetical protein OTU49_006144 [Cherax quadricarinatus]|uniref:Globin domain-containing protein n=1 Tax=Cherax quadricarinatus TaxID=27406 RepID=A0AAW0WQ35_CHEQU